MIRLVEGRVLAARRVQMGMLADGAAFAPIWWGSIGARERAHLLWDCPLADRLETLRIVLRDADLACAGFAHGKPCALAWASGFGGGSRAGIAHFSMNHLGREYKEILGRWFLRQAAHCGFMSLLCLVPRCWKFERAFILSLGFEDCGVLRGACRLAMRGRLYDGVIFRIDLGGDNGAV